MGRPLKLRQIWKQERPDVIVSFIGKMNLYAMLSVSRMSVPVILSVRSDPAREYPSRLQMGMANLLFQKAAGVVFQTEDAKRAFSAGVQAHASVLPNALDESFVRPRFTGKRKARIVMVGRLDTNKNHAMLLRAFARLHKNYPEVRVALYGAGLPGSDTEPALRSLAAELGIGEKVDFMGRQNHIREKIEDAWVFVLASDYEGMPNALLEAMATGLAVISTDCPCGGPRSVIRDGENGILIPVGDEMALMRALDRLLGDEALRERLGREAAKLAVELSPEKVCRLWQEEIEGRVKDYVGGKS